MKKIIFTIIVLFTIVIAKSQPGQLDPSFGNHGFVLTANSTNGNIRNETVHQIFQQADGKLLVVLDEDGIILVERRLSDGSFDPSYGTNGFSAGFVAYPSAAAIQPDGKILIAGNTNTPNRNFMLGRLNTDGSFDATFGNGGVVNIDLGADDDFLTSVALQADGKIISGGRTSSNGITEFALVRNNSNGTPDATFGSSGIVTTSFPDASGIVSITIQPADGKIVAAGNVNTNAGDFALARYNVDGSLDATFGTGGKQTSDFGSFENASAATLQADGKILIGGYASDASGLYHFLIARYNADGSPDLSYNGNGTAIAAFDNAYAYLQSVQLQSDGKLVASGYLSPVSGGSHFALSRFQTNGALDPSFGNSGTMTTDAGGSFELNYCMIAQSDGKLILGGSTFINNYDFALIRYDVNGSLDPTFASNGILTGFVPGSNFYYTSIFPLTDKKLIALGNSYDGTNSAVFLQRFNANGTADNTYGQNGFATINSSIAVATPDNKILIAGNNFAANADIALFKYNPDGSPDLTFGVNGTISSDFGGDEFPGFIALQKDNKIIVGGFVSNNGSHYDWIIIRYNADGSPDNTFGSGGKTITNFGDDDYPQVFAFAPDGKILVSGITNNFPDQFSVVTDVSVGRYNTDGTLDATFNNSGKLTIDLGTFDGLGSIAVQKDGKILVGSGAFQTDVTNYITRYNIDGTPDNSFGANSRIIANEINLVLQDDQKIVGGGYFTSAQGDDDFSVARFTSTGALDNTFGSNGKTITDFTPGDDVLYGFVLSDNQLFGVGYSRYENIVGILAKYNLEDQSTGLSCPANKIVSTDTLLCSAKVSGIDPVFPGASNTTIKYKLTGATKGSGLGSVSGKTFNKGITTVKYSLMSDTTQNCSFNVTVNDSIAPVIHNLFATPSILLHADHQLRDIIVFYSVDDNCSNVNTTLSVSSNEPVTSNEPGDKSPDWIIVSDHYIKLRAERLESGNGRIYTVKVSSKDASGNIAEKTTTVTVPKNKNCNLDISASPNPSSNSFLISVNSGCSNEKITLIIGNNKGLQVQKIENVYPGQSVRIGSGYQPGVYFVQATQGSETKTIKIVKL